MQENKKPIVIEKLLKSSRRAEKETKIKKIQRKSGLMYTILCKLFICGYRELH